MSDALIGLGACAISSICFGSMYVAVRKFDSGDGIFVQWVVCSAIFLVGMVVNVAQEFPQFQPLAMLGGVLWVLGNVTALPIIETIGLGMGILIWGATNCAVGWAAGRFGLFGIDADVPADPVLNYIGLILVMVGGVLFSLVKSSVKPIEPDLSVENNERSSLVPSNTRQVSTTVTSVNNQGDNVLPVVTELTDDSNSTSLRPRIIAIIASIFAGFCYGLNFVPVIYIQDHPNDFHNPPEHAIQYTFSHFSGIFLSSTAILIIYLAYTQNQPFVNGKIILPSLFAGLLWAVAQIAWFVANDLLSQAITFPINAMIPGVCGSLWSVFYFKEIEGTRNLRLLSIAIVITITGAILVGVSKSF